MESPHFREQGHRPERHPDLAPKLQREFETLKEELEVSGYPLWKIGNMMNPTELFMLRNDLYRWASNFKRNNDDSELGFDFIKGYTEHINNRLVELGN